MPDPTPSRTRSHPARESLEELATTFDNAAHPRLSAPELDVLQKEYAQNTQLATNAETHRSTVMSFIFTGAGAIVYALAAVKFASHYWPIALVLGILGAFAALLGDIYHERWMFYMMLARGYRWRIAAATPELRLEEIRTAAEDAHRSEFRPRVPLYAAWKWLALGIAFSGFASAVVMFVAVFARAK